jgi:CRP-like cAMP-binding protein
MEQPTLAASQAIHDALEHAEPAVLRPFEDAVHEGDICAGLHLVTYGSLLVTVRIGDETRIVDSIGPGALVGEPVSCGQLVRHVATVTAVRTSRIVLLPNEFVNTLIAANPAFGQALQVELDVARSRRMEALSQIPAA